MKKIAIDLPIIFDPHKFLIILAGLDHSHEEILVPDIVKYIELWSMPGDINGFLKRQPITLHLLEENFDERLDEFFGFDKKYITPNNFCAGIRLLQYAHKKEMITFFDSEKYTKIGQSVLKTEKIYPQFYKHNLPDGKNININPDLPYTLESLIGIHEENNTVPIFGDLDFLHYVNKKMPSATIRDNSGSLKMDEQTKILLECPKVVTFEELIWFTQNKSTFNSVSEKLEFGKEWNTTSKDVGFMGLKFGGTLATDLTLFGGTPISSGTLFGYELLSRILRVEKNKD